MIKRLEKEVDRLRYLQRKAWETDTIKRLEERFQAAQDVIQNREDTITRLREALSEFRSLVKEGGVPRYTITPGAALNSVIEEIVDPALRDALKEGK